MNYVYARAIGSIFEDVIGSVLECIIVIVPLLIITHNQQIIESGGIPFLFIGIYILLNIMFWIVLWDETKNKNDGQYRFWLSVICLCFTGAAAFLTYMSSGQNILLVSATTFIVARIILIILLLGVSRQ